MNTGEMYFLSIHTIFGNQIGPRVQINDFNQLSYEPVVDIGEMLT